MRGAIATPARGARIALLALLAVALGVAIEPVLPWLLERWQAEDGFFSHGPIVPLAVAWLLWRDRGHLRVIAEPKGEWRGLLLLVPGVLLLLVASWSRFDAPALAATLPIVGGLAWLLAGASFLRALAFPLAFLLFAVPWPMELLAEAVQALKQFVIAGATALVTAAGAAVEAHGSTLHLAGGERLLVDDECSGLSSAIALLALGCFLAGTARGLRWPARATIVALALPIALLANLLRVLLLTTIALQAGADAVSGWHDAANALVYVAAIGAFLVVERRLPHDATASAGLPAPDRRP